MHSIVTTFRGAVIKVEVANFGAAMDTLIDQDGNYIDLRFVHQVPILAGWIEAVWNTKFACHFYTWSLALRIEPQTV